MTHIQQCLHALSSFKYQPDKVNSWTLMSPPYRGDCEDWALTLAWMHAGSWLAFWWGVLTFRYCFWFVHIHGEGHAIIWIRGEGWFDNRLQRSCSFTELRSLGYKFRFPYLLPTLVWLIAK